MSEGVLERKVCGAGEDIFREGSEGHSAYIVQSGEIEIVKEAGDGEVLLGTVGKGGIFGEMALLDNSPRMATARSRDGATVIVVSRMMFQQKLAKADPFIRGLLKIFADNIRKMGTSAVAEAGDKAAAGEATETASEEDG